MPEDQREKIARALLVTGHPMPMPGPLREDRSAEYDRAIARVRAGLGLDTPHPSQEPTPQNRQTDAAADDVGQDAPLPTVADPEASGTGGSVR